MKKLFILIISISFITNSYSQTEKLSGPRVGFTIIGPGPIADFINTRDFDRLDRDYSELGKEVGDEGSAFITQYGWQWETRFADGYDMTGLVEWILLVGGIEKGLFLPSFSSLVGLRTSNNLEFAFGPNFSLSGVGAVIAIGKNFKLGELNLPVNIAFRPGINKRVEREIFEVDSNGNQTYMGEEEATVNTGSLFSLVVGFNLGR